MTLGFGIPGCMSAGVTNGVTGVVIIMAFVDDWSLLLQFEPRFGDETSELIFICLGITLMRVKPQ